MLETGGTSEEKAILLFFWLLSSELKKEGTTHFLKVKYLVSYIKNFKFSTQMICSLCKRRLLNNPMLVSRSTSGHVTLSLCLLLFASESNNSIFATGISLL
ncbi:unnamed protein product [Eruca vesicaria subsp. sativa]|uniref:Uncharacterized protein n=1 Tax=Eruca vesicaria subsp. sativa TaxID=29727 RepID=A0ABC8JE98_ERUVS|nr:unnamed protein product [Eruca vesicaria subsp. sativa]